MNVTDETSPIEKAYATLERVQGSHIDICDEKGRWQGTSVKKIIPMLKNGEIIDVEILIRKDLNRYFSLKQLTEETSWVREIRIHINKDRRLKKGIKYLLDLRERDLIVTAVKLHGLLKTGKIK